MANAARKNLELDLKVGAFVLAGLTLVAAAIITLGGSDNLLTRNNTYYTHFNSIDGLIPGAKVSVGGFQVGSVTEVEFDPEKRDLRVTYKVATKYKEWLRKDSMAEILTQGMLGDKFVSIVQGDPSQEILPDRAEVTPRIAKDLTQFLSQGDKLMGTLSSLATSIDQVVKGFERNGRSEIFFESLASTTKNLSKQLDGMKLKESVDQLHAILGKINNGTGTLGALVNDPGLYYDVRALMGGANRNKVMRNLVRQSIKDGEKREMQNDPGPGSAP